MNQQDLVIQNLLQKIASLEYENAILVADNQIREINKQKEENEEK